MARNPEQARKSNKKWRDANKVEIANRKKAYREAHKGEIKLQRQNAYQEDKESILAQANDRYQNDAKFREEKKARSSAYYYENQDMILAKTGQDITVKRPVMQLQVN